MVFRIVVFGQQETYYKASDDRKESIRVLIVDSTGIRLAMAATDILVKCMAEVSRRAG